MAQPLWLYIDGGLLMAIGDYVLTDDVNADFAKGDYTETLKAQQIYFLFL